MFNRELVLMNENRIGLKGMSVAGDINENITIIKANSFVFVYAFDRGESIDIVTQTSYGDDSTLSLKKGDELELVIKTLQLLS